jgi:hypothetical protein
MKKKSCESNKLYCIYLCQNFAIITITLNNKNLLKIDHLFLFDQFLTKHLRLVGHY